jgi:oxygen-independent coproporphyrinogen-3 oxidase
MGESSTLIARARDLYRAYAMDQLPVVLRRNSIDYYYLSVYPGLKQMSSFGKLAPPRYPDAISNAYIHIPFCTGVCSFCSYFLSTVKAGDLSRIAAYLELVKQELALHQAETRLDLSYIYFGGGTPSLIPPATLAELFGFLSSEQILAECSYGTFELHPEFFGNLDTAQAFVNILRVHGVNRVSLGVESSDQALLDRTNRRHGTSFLTQAMEFLRDNSLYVNIDLMYGLPGMTCSQWEDSLRTVTACAPDSISAYFLFVDRGTPMHASVERSQIDLPAHEEIQVQHIMTQIYLEECGYYELPNDYYAKLAGDPAVFTVDSLPSDAVSLPIGAGAYGFFDRTQFANVFNLAEYGDRINRRQSPMWRGCRLDDDGLMRRDIMFGFKNSPYLDLQLFVNKYGISPTVKYDAIFDFLSRYGLVDIDDAHRRATLTAKGRLCVEEISCLFRPRARPETAAGTSARERRLLEKHNFAPTYQDLDEKFTARKGS